MPRRITPKRYAVEYDGPDGLVEYEVRVITADILRAEETGPTYGITNPKLQAIAMTALWVWAASVREGPVGKVSWPEFRKSLIDYDKVGEEDPVDPTQPAGLTPSPSPSGPLASEDSTSTGGSEPSPTTPPSSN